MKKTIDIEIPKDYSAVSLKKYLRIQDDLERYKDDKEAQDAFLLWNIIGLTPKIINKLDSQTLNSIKGDLASFLGRTDFKLQKFVDIDGVKYGFEPNLSKMAYGAYLDISSHKDLSINKDWASIMNILYRPVTKTKGALYSIEPYDNEKQQNKEKWLSVNMDIHFGCFFFFNRILKELSKGTLKSLTEQALEDPEVNPHTKRILEESGALINRLLS
jgi:hypothetical protein|tara:strand:- start:690 stop:1337 length:648 start_codon:yes stop_codon:yes gene_type:complete